MRDITDPEHPYSLEQARAHTQGGFMWLGQRDPRLEEASIQNTVAPLTPPRPTNALQLRVVTVEQISVEDAAGTVRVEFTPTVEHCSMATLIGLCLRAQLARSLPPRFRCDVAIRAGTHASEAAVNKQLADKERVAAALENPNLVELVNKALQGADARSGSGGA